MTTDDDGRRRRTTDESALEKLRCLSAGGAKKEKKLLKRFWDWPFPPLKLTPTPTASRHLKSSAARWHSGAKKWGYMGGGGRGDTVYLFIVAHKVVLIKCDIQHRKIMSCRSYQVEHKKIPDISLLLEYPNTIGDDLSRYICSQHHFRYRTSWICHNKVHVWKLNHTLKMIIIMHQNLKIEQHNIQIKRYHDIYINMQKKH